MSSAGFQVAKSCLISSLSPPVRRGVVPITFQDWYRGGIFDWYHNQPHTVIHKLELRKERDRFKHEFVVAYVGHGRAYRVDRRPLEGSNSELILSKGCRAEDSITSLCGDDLRAVTSKTDVMVAVRFGSRKKPDLYTIITICVSVRMDPECASYTLQLYNCYFLARTITTLLVRHHLIHIHNGFRWDCSLTECIVSRHMFTDGWTTLDRAMKETLIATLDKIVWPIVKDDAELLIQNRKQLIELQEAAGEIIRETVEQIENLVVAPLKNAMLRWVFEATSETLWYDGLEQSLSVPRYKQEYETAAKEVLIKIVTPQLTSSLPNKIAAKLDELLPKRLISRLPSSLLALLPPELWARIPVRVLEKAPDETIRNLPTDLLVKAPDEFLQKIPPHVFARGLTPMILTLPEDLDRVPQSLLHVSFKRMLSVLDQSTPGRDRFLALQLLKRLPNHILEAVPKKFMEMRNKGIKEVPEPDPDPGIGEDKLHPLMPEPTVNQLSDPVMILQRACHTTRIGLNLARFVLSPALSHLPVFMTEQLPNSILEVIPTDTLARLAPSFLARLQVPFLEKLPQELLRRVPEDLLRKLPRETLERLPDGLLNKIPEQLLRNIPIKLIESLPENVSDPVRQTIETEISGRKEVVADLVNLAGDLAKAALIKSSGELPTSLLQISVARWPKAGNKANVTIGTHQELQQYILDRTRDHSKMVAQLAQLGQGEETIYNALRQKTEDVWRVVRLHSYSPPGTLKVTS